MSIKDFYNNFDLMYPELAINAEPINRLNPGVCKFYIPVLTPYMDRETVQSKKEYFHRTNMLNVKPNLFDVKPIEIINYIEIPVAPEVCHLNLQIIYSENGDIQDNTVIPAQSKWVVIFIGGDINNPVIISKLP